MTMKKYLILAMLLPALLSCKKAEEQTEEPAPKDKKYYLTNAKWKLLSLDIKIDGEPVAYSIKACDEDNRTKYSSNGTGVVDYGSTLCGTETDLSFDWEFQQNEAKLLKKLRYNY